MSSTNKSEFDMLPVSDALEIVLSHAAPRDTESIALYEAFGRVVARDIFAREPLPPFAAAVKDGYAVVASDGPGEYPIVGEVTAGHPGDFALAAGEVAYITTGAPMPPGADAVVMIEETEPASSRDGQQRVRIGKRVGAGDDVRGIGADVEPGQLVVAQGERLGAAEIGLLATVGTAFAEVYARPRVAVLSTGDELVEPDAPLVPGAIRDSNRVALLAAAKAGGAEVVDLGIARDERVELEERMRHGLQHADILVTSGGVSMGNLDLIKPIMGKTGTVHFGRILMKPGKPLTFATVDVDGRQRLVFGLPGNPVSSLVTFYLFVVPAVRKLLGWSDPYLRRIGAVLAQDLPLDPERPEYHRALLRWDLAASGGPGFVASSTGRQASSRLLSMRSATALLELPQGRGVLKAGDRVNALLIGEL